METRCFFCFCGYFLGSGGYGMLVFCAVGCGRWDFALKFLVYSAKEYSLIKWAGKWFLCDLGEKDGEKRAYKK